MALTEWEVWALWSSDQERAVVNKTQEGKGTKMGSISRVSSRDRWHQGEKHSPCVELRCGTSQCSKEPEKNDRTTEVLVRLNFRERWDFLEKGHKVTRDMSLRTLWLAVFLQAISQGFSWSTRLVKASSFCQKTPYTKRKWCCLHKQQARLVVVSLR